MSMHLALVNLGSSVRHALQCCWQSWEIDGNWGPGQTNFSANHRAPRQTTASSRVIRNKPELVCPWYTEKQYFPSTVSVTVMCHHSAEKETPGEERKEEKWKRRRLYIYKFLLRFYLSSSVRSGPHYYLGSSTLSLTQWTCAVCGVLWSLLVLFNSLHSILQCCS